MKKSIGFITLFISLLLTITGFAVVALAEPSDAPITEETVSSAVESGVESAAESPEASVEVFSESSEPAAESSEIPVESEPEVSVPESSEPEVSEPESGEPESSEPESSEAESSEPESSEPESSEPESSDLESTEPESSEPESSEPESSEPEVSEPESSEAESSEPEVSDADTSEVFDIRVNAGNGGSLTVGESVINGGNGTQFTVNAGGSLVFAITPDEGYEIDSFKIDGAEIEITENTYTMSEISASAVVSVSFKTIEITVEPEVSVPEVSQPEVSQPIVNPPVMSEPEESEPEDTAFDITFSVSGIGKISVYKTADSSLITEIVSDGSAVVSQTLTVDAAIKFSVTPAADGQLQGVEWTEPHRAVTDEYYYLVPSRDSTVDVTFTGGTSVPDSSDADTSEVFDIRVDAGTGGSLTVGESVINGGNGTQFTVNAGGSLVFAITPDEGYEIDSFKIDGAEIEITENTYTMSEISASAVVSVSFKTIGSTVEPEGIGADSIDWNADTVTVDVTDGKTVLRDVFDKIASLTPVEGRYVEFISENGTIYVPYGGVAVGTAKAVNMSVLPLSEGAEYNAIETAFRDTEMKFKVFTVDVTGNALPSGTKIAFNLGGDFASAQASLLVYTGSALNPKGDAAAVSAEGVSGQYDYSNENILVCATGIPGSFTIEATLVNAGGNINPQGKSEVPAGTDSSYVITATEGYYIKKILVDEAEIPNVEGLNTYIHIFESVGADHTIQAEFAANTVVSDTAEESSGNGTLVVVLIIVFVAVLGAAALFIVKWRQEKF